MNYEAINLSLEGPVSRLVLKRGSTGSQVDSRLLRELSDAAEQLRDAATVRVVLLSAEGPDFCRGWSSDLTGEHSDIGEYRPDPFGPIAALPMPVAVALRGRVISAGLELALACDIRIAAADTSFAMPETEEGLIPMAGGSQRLPRTIGPGMAMAMILTGEVLDANAAYRCGLVSKVVATEDLAAEAETLVQEIAGRGPIALRYAKEAVHRGLDMTLDQALRYETDLTVILQTTADRAEGVRAFIEKRPPRFDGS